MNGPNSSVWQRERMAAVDAAWLRLDGQRGPSAIVALLLLEAAPDPEALRQMLRRRLLAVFPRFSQRVVQAGDTWWWEGGDALALQDHLVVHRRAAGGSLQGWVNRWAAAPLDPSRPLWRIDYWPRSEAESVLLIRVHHCVADGLALMDVLHSLADAAEAPAPPLSGAATEAPDWARHIGDLMAAAVAEPGTWAERSRKAAEWASATWLRHRQARGSTVRLQAGRLVSAGVKPGAAQRSSAPGKPPQRTRQWRWTDARSRTETAALAAALGVSLHALVLGALAHALRYQLQACGESVEGLQLEALIPVSLRKHRRTAGALGNHIGWVPVALPLGDGNPYQAVASVQAQWRTVRSSPLAGWSWNAMGWMGHLPAVVQHSAVDAWAGAASLVCTQVPGPREPLTLAGVAVKDLMFWVPQAGPIGLGISICSYADRLRIGMVADATTLPDADGVMQAVEQALDTLLWGLMLAPEDAWGDPAAMARAVAQATEHPCPPPSSDTAPGPGRRGRVRPGS